MYIKYKKGNELSTICDYIMYSTIIIIGKSLIPQMSPQELGSVTLNALQLHTLIYFSCSYKQALN